MTDATPRTFHGSCHCGAIEIELTDDLSRLYAGNCSICRRAGWILAFPKQENLRILKGERATTDYQFGKKNVHHTFCATCGVRVFSRGKNKAGEEVYVVNVRCLDGVDVSALAPKPVDCAAL